MGVFAERLLFGRHEGTRLFGEHVAIFDQLLDELVEALDPGVIPSLIVLNVPVDLIAAVAVSVTLLL